MLVIFSAPSFTIGTRYGLPGAMAGPGGGVQPGRAAALRGIPGQSLPGTTCCRRPREGHLHGQEVEKGGTWGAGDLVPPRTGPIPTATIGTIVKQPSSIIDGGNLNKSDMAVDVYPGNQSLQCEIPKWYPSIDEFTIKLFSIAKFDHQSHWKRSHAKCQPRIHTKNGDCPDPKSTSRNGIDDFLSTLYIYIN